MSQLIPEKELLHFIEMTPDLVCMANREGFFLWVNQSVLNTFEYTREELMSRPIASFIHPDDKAHTAQKRQELLRGEKLVNLDNRYISKSGRVVWLQWSSIFFPEKNIVLALAKDVTLRKEKETETEEKYRRFRILTAHFKSSLEKDKKFLALELHEDLAQLTSAIKLDLEWLRSHLTETSEEVRSTLQHAYTRTASLLESIRNISYTLSPNLLEDIGLKESVEWLCSEFQNNHGIPCSCHWEGDPKRLNSALNVDLFRICQEALQGIFDQLAPAQLEISISVSNDSLKLNFNGIPGISPFSAAPDEMLAQTSLRERVESIGGEIVFGLNEHNNYVLEVLLKEISRQ